MGSGAKTYKTKWNKPVGILLLLAGAALLGYFGLWAAGKYIHWSFDIGLAFLLVCGLLLAVSGALLLHGGVLRWFSRHRFFNRLLLVMLAVFLLSFASVEGLVLRDARLDDRAVPADFVLIPGATVVGGRPSLILQHRLDGALPYLRAHHGVTVIVSGAKGAGEAYSEAEVMKNYLVGKGINAKRIIEEERATDTIGNVAYTKQIISKLRPGEAYKLMIVTSDYHMFRVLLLARSQGLDAYGIAVTVHIGVAPICYSREYFSIIKLLLTGLRSE